MAKKRQGAQRIVIDTDPGVDDAVAILLAFASPELEVLGLTAVAGNVPLDLTQANARALCDLAGRPDAKVFAGCPRPLLRPLVRSRVHGATGLGGAKLPKPKTPLQPRHAVEWLVETVMEAPAGTIALATLGPLTNVATAIAQEPRIAKRLQGIVAMGGASLGNITPAAEFNIFFDPHAAAAVVDSGARIALVPLELTRQALVTKERLARLRALGTPAARAVSTMLAGYTDVEEEGLPLHDPCVIAYLIDPAMFEGTLINVAVETVSELTMGMTLMDWRGVSRRKPNCTVLTRLDAGRFFELLFSRLARL